MLIRIKAAKMVDNSRGSVCIELEGVKPAGLDIGQAKMRDYETNAQRELTEVEASDLEEALEGFYKTQIARILAKRIQVE